MLLPLVSNYLLRYSICDVLELGVDFFNIACFKANVWLKRTAYSYLEFFCGCWILQFVNFDSLWCFYDTLLLFFAGDSDLDVCEDEKMVLTNIGGVVGTTVFYFCFPFSLDYYAVYLVHDAIIW